MPVWEITTKLSYGVASIIKAIVGFCNYIIDVEIIIYISISADIKG